uniref:Uncharacterized protein n=1 Tax=Anguilla anguilla TaxID=7936 RepID=A0A0E9V001_ANGAN
MRICCIFLSMRTTFCRASCILFQWDS